MGNDIDQTIKAPAIALIVSGALNGTIGLLSLLGGLLRLVVGIETLPDNEAEKAGFVFGTIIGYVISFLTLVAAPFIILGGIRMLSARNIGLARLSAVLSILPIFSCCFLIGVPIGIWALIVISKPEVREYFAGQSGAFSGPPGPPAFR